jgi:uncharacterized MAPEG superfamily protein
MTTELYWLTLTVLMTALFWVPYVLNRMAVGGVRAALAGNGPENGPLSPWAQRAIKAHANAVETLVIFVPAVLAVQALGTSTPATRAAAAIYFFARLAHFLVYTAGLPVVRTLTFAIGWAAQLVILASVLRWL